MDTFKELTTIFKDITSKLVESTEPNTLYKAAVQIAMQHTDAQACSLYLEAAEKYVGDLPHTISMVAGAGYEQHRLGSKYEKGQGLTGSIWEKSEIVKFDTQEDIENRKGSWEGLHNKKLKGKVKNWKCSSLIGVPLRIGDRTIGVLKVENKEPGPPAHFSYEDQNTLEIIASTIAMAIENQRLTEQSHSIILNALRDVSEMSVRKQTVSFQSFCDRIVQICVEVFNAQACSLYLEPYEQKETEYIEMISGAGYEQHRLGSKYEKGQGLTGSIWEKSEIVKFDTQEDIENRKGSWEGLHNKKLKGKVKNWKCSSLIGVPLRIGDRAIGVLKVENKTPAPQSHFNHNELRSLEIIASNIALSIEMQRNYEFLFKKGERARDFTHSLRNKIKTAILNTKDAKSKLHKEDISSVSRCLEIIDSTLSEIKEYQKSALTDDEGTKLNLPISELIIELRKLIENEKRISFKISQTDEERYLHVNKAQILEGLENIIGNAIDSFSHEEKARLWIDIHIVENSPVEQAVITITDNGKGLTGEQKKEFKKNKTITSTKRFSLGTGIARANRCFADNSGHFEYQDPSPDKTDRGTSFVITLPAYKPQDLRILIVDDEKGTLETFKRKVGEIKNLIADYSSSLKIFQQDMGRKDSGFKSYINTFDWILLDCHFKDSSKDGTNIFKEYAELNKKISNKIILMSGEESYLMRGDIKILDKYEDILNDFSKFISSLNKAEGVDK